MHAKLIALAGKGGVGKTSISAAMIRVLTERRPDAKILAIDADPAVGLAAALGVRVEKTLDDIRREIVADAGGGKTKEAVELLGEARFRLLDSMVESPRFSFLAIGRPESAGCYCRVNDYLRDVIGMMAEDFDYVVIDGEAGVEQINRRVFEKVTHLVLVTDPSRRGFQVADTIRRVAGELVMYEKTGVILNRLPDPALLREMPVPAEELLAAIPADAALARGDVLGESVFRLPDGCPILAGAEQALRKIGVLEEGCGS
jgi:CO dehydrogenase maturation factor